MKKILTYILAFMCMLLTFPATVSADELDIYEELKNVDLSAYKYSKDIEVITVTEVGFCTDDYGLVVYVWNGKNLMISNNYTSNAITLATDYDESTALSYDKFNLKCLGNTSDNLVYKFCVYDATGTLRNYAGVQNATYKKRRYAVASVELYDLVTCKVTDYKIGKTFSYSGFNDSLTLETFDVLTLDVHSSFYRTESSDNGAFHQNQLNSVYFSIPTKYLENGNEVSSIKATWYELKTKPIAVVEDIDVYNALYPYRYVPMGYNRDLPSLSAGFFPQVSEYWSFYNYDIAYNVGVSSPYINTTYNVRERISPLTFIFNTNGVSASEYVLQTETLLDYIKNCTWRGASVEFIDTPSNTYVKNLFEDSVDNGRCYGENVKVIKSTDTFDMFSYSDTHNWFDTVADYGLINTLFGRIPTDQSITGIKPFYAVTSEDLSSQDVSKNLLIDPSCLTDFVSFNATLPINETCVLFRFGVTDYYCQEFDYMSDSKGYFCQTTAFLDFDIIEISFSNGKQNIVVPVSSNPIDVLFPSTPPVVFDGNNWWIYSVGIVLVSLLGIILSLVFRSKR